MGLRETHPETPGRMFSIAKKRIGVNNARAIFGILSARAIFGILSADILRHHFNDKTAIRVRIRVWQE
jgi:hypothetical protein